MDEREKAIAGLQGSAAVHGSSDLGAQRKDHLSRRELKRERHEEGNRKVDAAQGDNFLAVQLKTGWTQRALQSRQSIALLCSRQQDAERVAEASKAASTPAASAAAVH